MAIVHTAREVFMSDSAGAIDFEMIQVRERTVACDGGGGPLGHPRVYLKIEDREVTCPYCSRHYVLTGNVTPGEGH
ncbi:hypothetical protein ACMV_15510 [Acidiphilium multivorum AIU301]|uniref:Zinc finger CHCC-type domain-containing protein n=3 Tax=Acidiphilium TaxID=522 RepID=F0IYN8_ACIMA|nr:MULTISPECIES: zinc-finger domain-containing protein [Acidiphilium]BAJ80898.1 hypothetical protein ACMV_15510 [Acidiphilium multivorum AIU301]